jgi:hypothetical protein
MKKSGGGNSFNLVPPNAAAVLTETAAEIPLETVGHAVLLNTEPNACWHLSSSIYSHLLPPNFLFLEAHNHCRFAFRNQSRIRGHNDFPSEEAEASGAEDSKQSSRDMKCLFIVFIAM